MSIPRFYPVGTPGVPWGEVERAEWRARQVRSRSYADDVVTRVRALADRFEIEQYGELSYGGDTFPLLAVTTRAWRDDLPVALVTGGVHGYETSGVLGALAFAEDHAAAYQDRFNLLIVPCVSPWAYERICRWNYHAVDPNRQFGAQRDAQESRDLLTLIAPHVGRFALHIDLHETTDTDYTEFRPAKAARDGKPLEEESIPDGFYLVCDSQGSSLEFQQAVIAAVEQVTHIAPPDERGEILNCPVVSNGVIAFATRQIGLCGGITGSRLATTTEVYPDSPKTTPENCIEAQVRAVVGAFEFAVKAAA